MALTAKKRRFAEALSRGAALTDAAVEAGYSERGAASVGSRLSRDADVLAEVSRLRGGDGEPCSLPRVDDPKEFLLAAMNDASLDVKLRQDAAKALMPYLHPKLGESGKKDKQREAAKERASGKFAPGAAPALRVVGK